MRETDRRAFRRSSRARRNARAPLLLALAATVSLLPGCGSRDEAARDLAVPDAAGPEATAPAPEPHDPGGSTIPPLDPEVRLATAEQVLSDVRGAGSEAVLVNVWATWCTPCRAEFPDLVRLHHAYRERGLKLVLVSADFDDDLPDVKRFLAKHGVDFPSYLKAGDDMRFINTMSPEWTGALPATFIYDGEGRLRHFREGMATFATFEKEVLRVLNSETAKVSGKERS